MARYVDGDELDVETIACAVAVQVSRRFSGYVDHDDMKQECWLWWYDDTAGRRRIDGLIEKGETRKAAWLVQKEMSQHCTRLARKAKAAWSGYDTTDEQFYTLEAIKSALPAVLYDDPEMGQLREGATAKRKPGEVVAKTDPAEGGGWHAVFADVKSAVEQSKLSTREKQCLFLVHGMDLTQDEAADILDVTQGTVSKAVRRALEKVSDALGGTSPWDQSDPLDEALRKRPGVRSGWSGMEQEVEV